jgi:hypothetical protein
MARNLCIFSGSGVQGRRQSCRSEEHHWLLNNRGDAMPASTKTKPEVVRDVVLCGNDANVYSSRKWYVQTSTMARLNCQSWGALPSIILLSIVAFLSQKCFLLPKVLWHSTFRKYMHISGQESQSAEVQHEESPRRLLAPGPDGTDVNI